MIVQKIKKWLIAISFSVVLAGEVTVLLDLIAAWLEMETQRIMFVCSFAGLFLVFLTIPKLTNKRRMAAAAGIPLGIIALAVSGFLFWKSFSTNAVYLDVDSGKERLYANHRVMLIVPHEDDEINVLGGVMEEYVKYGSEVYPVFVTNGDYDGLAEIRFQEALAVAEYIGIPDENVIFLGYGDQWAENGPHIYNAEPGTVVTSWVGKTETYGTSSHGVFSEGRAYTIDNLMEDMKAVIMKYGPDVIFCSDYDSHIDHKATTLIFEKVMGEILKAEPDYRPVVYKGYAYKTAWYAEADYYETNILSTANVFEDPYWQKPEVYHWEERVRLPVRADALSRSVCSSDIYHTLALHESQGAFAQAGRVINGDRVVWKRDTNSLCYNAEIETSSASANVLNDFMLIDNDNLVEEHHSPYDGTWIPEAGDTEKRVTVTFADQVDISNIVLYDHPSEEQNILNAVILFDDGTSVNTGCLDAGGAATRIPVEKYGVRSFTVVLCDTEGAQAGLTEIEAYQDMPEQGFGYIKLMDEEGNFAYDYWVDADGYAEFGLYSYGDVATTANEGLQITCDNEKCEAAWKNGVLKVNCPKGETAVITVTCAEMGVSDSICVRNPGFWQRLQCSVGQKMEAFFLQGYFDGRYCNSVTYEIFDILRYKLEHLLT